MVTKEKINVDHFWDLGLRRVIILVFQYFCYIQLPYLPEFETEVNDYRILSTAFKVLYCTNISDQSQPWTPYM